MLYIVIYNKAIFIRQLHVYAYVYTYRKNQHIADNKCTFKQQNYSNTISHTVKKCYCYCQKQYRHSVEFNAIVFRGQTNIKHYTFKRLSKQKQQTLFLADLQYHIKR